jgi:hypothetical protein
MSVSTVSPEAPVTSWCRKGCACGRERGKETRAQMRLFALNVAFALTGAFECVHCGSSVSLHKGEVDRVSPGTCYMPGNVVMVCTDCNEALGQEGKTDIGDFDRARYAADVLRVSLEVPVPRRCDAVRAFSAKPSMKDQLRKSPYMR